jgi:eukaryotic-like serine/threonine-protein kinase
MLKKSFLLNVLLIVAAFVAILFAFFKSLHIITKHGQDAQVPKVEGQKLNTALKVLQGFELQVDSIYLPYKDPLEIIYQEPKAGTLVKKGRTIFITVNKISPPSISMPNLVNLSFRNAVLTLQSYRLIMGDTIFKPDIAAGSVLEQMCNGVVIMPGTQLPIGSRVDLVVGTGLSDSIINVPDLIGKSFAEAKAILAGCGIEPNVVWDGAITDSLGAIVYNQFPESKNELDFTNTINPGDLMDIRIMQRPSAELLRLNQAGSQKYLDPNDTNAQVTYGPNQGEVPIGTDVNGQIIPVQKPKPKKQATQEDIDKLIHGGNTSDKNANDNNGEDKIPETYKPPKPSTDAKKESNKPNATATTKPDATTVKPKAKGTTATEPKPDANKNTTPTKPKNQSKQAIKETNKNSNEEEYK